MRQIKKEVVRNPLQTSRELFESAGVPDVPKSTRCRVLRRTGKCERPEVRPPLKVHFPSVLFTDECRATLDGPGGWRRGWYCKVGPRPERIRRQ